MNELKDGTYTVDAALTGGSGRANIRSPAELTVKDGEIKAEIEWDSPYYDYMEIDGREYYPVNDGGNSVFLIDAELDRDIPVKAETLAMSQPHMIDYTLYLDSGTLRGKGPPPLAVTAIVLAAAAVCALAAVLIMKRRRGHGKK